MYVQLTVVTTSPSENYHDHSPSGQVSLNSDTKHENSMERARGVYSTALSHKIIDTREKKKKVIAVVESFTSIVNRLA